MARKKKPTRVYGRDAITPIEYGGLQDAYEHFNDVLFENVLPDVFITYQRKANSYGYFSPDRFAGRIGEFDKHELALNPDAFIGQSDEQVCQTLVHEMVHAWQHVFGKAPARGYHNKQWAWKMKQVGLQPSNTGMVGGKETGQRMSDYIIPDGPFTKAYAKLAATGWGLNLQSAHHPGGTKTPNSKTKFTCLACGQNVWGKPDTAVICKPCLLAALDDPRSATTISRFQMRAPIPTSEPAPEPAPSYEPEPVPSYEPIAPALIDAEPPKRRGRPKGSKNKPKALADTLSNEQEQPINALVWKKGAAPDRNGHHDYEAKAGQGIYRITPALAFPSLDFSGYAVAHKPPGGKSRWLADSLKTIERAKAVAQAHADQALSYDAKPTPPRKRGRPKGSKNRPKAQLLAAE